MTLLLPLPTSDTLNFLLASITQSPEGDVSFAGEAGKTQAGMVFTHFLVQAEKLFKA
ncbi:hypothetical protein [Deinococcus xinjiangensis]|uniref:hypothetical protein n=1 Tax=Deinococcus xinjiangensis TaxID=457454 RepID=UPI0033658E63